VVASPDVSPPRSAPVPNPRVRWCETRQRLIDNRGAPLPSEMVERELTD
jgi:hypothetical protein